MVCRIVSLIIGYAFGLFQTAYIYGRMHGIDIREHGSGNAGTTNVLRTLGKKAGIITYLGDMLKAVFASLVIHLVFGSAYADIEMVLFCYCGLGVVLGHNYPFYLGFKGGKGIAASSGVILSFSGYDVILPIAGFFTFFISTFTTRYVSVGSLALMLAFAVEFIIFGAWGHFGLSTAALFEADILVIIITAFAFIRHRENIKRLYNNNERKIGEKKVK